MDLTWGELFKQLGNLDSFAPPIANGPIDGIVLKPKKGKCARDVVMMDAQKELVVRHPNVGWNSPRQQHRVHLRTLLFCFGRQLTPVVPPPIRQIHLGFC